MEIININFNNNIHCKSIKLLSKRNNFYVFDINKHLDQGLWKTDQDKGFFITNKQKPIGFIKIFERLNSNIIDITYLLITKTKRNQGFGTKLLNYVKKIYKNHVIILNSNNKKSVKWYTHQGFVKGSSFLTKVLDKYKLQSTNNIDLDMDNIINSSLYGLITTHHKLRGCCDPKERTYTLSELMEVCEKQIKHDVFNNFLNRRKIYMDLLNFKHMYLITLCNLFHYLCNIQPDQVWLSQVEDNLWGFKDGMHSNRLVVGTLSKKNSAILIALYNSNKLKQNQQEMFTLWWSLYNTTESAKQNNLYYMN